MSRKLHCFIFFIIFKTPPIISYYYSDYHLTTNCSKRSVDQITINYVPTEFFAKRLCNSSKNIEYNLLAITTYHTFFFVKKKIYKKEDEETNNTYTGIYVHIVSKLWNTWWINFLISLFTSKVEETLQSFMVL